MVVDEIGKAIYLVSCKTQDTKLTLSYKRWVSLCIIAQHRTPLLIGKLGKLCSKYIINNRVASVILKD